MLSPWQVAPKASGMGGHRSGDREGNVTQRQDSNLGLTENFYYDTMNRLSHSTLNGTTNLSLTYDTMGMGNIASRSDVAGGAAWTYDPTHKHQVTQAGSSAYPYAYDANGNVTSRNGSLITWTSYNYPDGINSAYFAQGRPGFHGKAVQSFTACRSSAREAGRAELSNRDEHSSIA